MFGLEEQKKKKAEAFVFELEKDLKNPAKAKELKAKAEQQIQTIKSVLKTGEEREEFDKFGVLLHGYTSLLKVMARCPGK